MNKIKLVIVALALSLAAFFLTPPTVSYAGTPHPNGKVCVKTTGSDVDAWIDVYWRNPSTGKLWLGYVDRGYCSDWYHLYWPIAAIVIPQYWKCTSQWGYVYNGPKMFAWDQRATASTRLDLTCKKTFLN